MFLIDILVFITFLMIIHQNLDLKWLIIPFIFYQSSHLWLLQILIFWLISII